MERLRATLSRCLTHLLVFGNVSLVILYAMLPCFAAGPNTFDSPSDVAAAMAGSLAGMMDVVSPDFKKQGSIIQNSSGIDLNNIKKN